VRYWFTRDGVDIGQLTFTCYYAAIGSNKIHGAFYDVSPAHSNADTYLEITFINSPGTLASNTDTGEFQAAISRSGNFTQSNDYSFNASMTVDYALNNKVAGYIGSTLKYGIDPAMGSLEIYYQAYASSASSTEIRPYFRIKNTGDTTINLSELSIRYWFTGDGYTTFNTNDCWNPSVLCSNMTRSIVPNPNPKPLANYYFLITFSSGAGTLSPGVTTADIQVRFYETDWHSLDQSNDYSFSSDSAYISPNFGLNSHITAYINSTCMFGTEP
jgi:hypothetical protein